MSDQGGLGPPQEMREGQRGCRLKWQETVYKYVEKQKRRREGEKKEEVA